MLSGTDMDKLRYAIVHTSAAVKDISAELQKVQSDLEEEVEQYVQAAPELNPKLHAFRGGLLTLSHSFPSSPVYMASLIALDIVVWLLAAFLLFRAVQKCRQRRSIEMTERHSSKAGSVAPLGLDTVVVQKPGQAGRLSVDVHPTNTHVSTSACFESDSQNLLQVAPPHWISHEAKKAWIV
ncbi:hypothetical protein AAVH_38168 [Aphelenchoides avenae]|nr:hypothetical protein AAVH_38168 [Aphelenchus avenae]